VIVLDTNVVSELMRQEPSAQVQEWFDKQQLTNLAISSISIGEIQRGLHRLPEGKRRRGLIASFEKFMAEAFSGCILPYDEYSANVFGLLAAERERAGFNTDPVDLMIAAIAHGHHAAIATRNVRDFEGCGVTVINPWLKQE